MKKEKTEREVFKDYCKTVEKVEGDKDRFLKASRLERHESKREPFRAADMIKIAFILGIAAICCTVLILGYLSGELGIALIFVIGLIVILGIGILLASDV